MPAEWEPHAAIWLSWPHDEMSFPGRVGKVQEAVVKIVASIYKTELVELLVLDDGMKTAAGKKLASAGVDISKISFRLVNYIDGWMRDCGPIFVKSGNEVSLVKWIFNQKTKGFPNVLPDDRLPDRLKEWLNLKMQQPELVLEGGAIEVNGQGLCLTTEQCVLNENRNGGKTKKDVERFFASYLGIKKTIWLWKGLVNDHTDGHIDELARFVSPNKILCAYEDDPKDENYSILKNNYETLVVATDLAEKPFEVVKLPMPHMNYVGAAAGLGGADAKAPISYTNFYIGNTVVLAAVFNDPNDEKALKIIRDCFPGRTVVPIDCSDIIYGGGAVHCMTQQQPRA